MQRELAGAYERVADVRGGIGGNLGDTAGAFESYATSLRIREALLAANPSDAQSRRDVARSHQKIGFLLHVKTPTARDGLERLRKAAALYLDLAREHPANLDFQLELADTRGKLAQALHQHGDVGGALEQHRAALALCEAPAAANPHDHRFSRALFNNHRSVATVLSSQGDVAGAIAANDKAVAIAERMLADDPHHREHRRAAVVGYRNGASYRLASDKAGALQFLRRALALQEESLAADPADKQLRQDLAFTHKEIADILADLKENAQALPHFSKAREIFEKMAADAPGDLSSRFRVATCGAGLAGMQARLGQVDPALEECRKSVGLLREISEDASNSLHRSLRAQAYEYLAYTYQSLAELPQASATEKKRQWSAARDMFQECLKILEDLRSRGLLDPREEPWAKKIADEVAKCDTALAK